MGMIIAANQKVEVFPTKLTWLETIHRGNLAGRKVMSNSFLSEVLLGKEDGIFNPIPEDIFNARPLYTGTAAVAGNKGKALRMHVESQCDFEGSMKTVIIKPDAEYAGLVDTLLTCDHGFAPDGKTPLLLLSNAGTGKQIRSDNEMREADEVLLDLNGQKCLFKIKSRDGGVFETVGDENTFIWISDSATSGLLRRGFVLADDRRYVNRPRPPAVLSSRGGDGSQRRGFFINCSSGTENPHLNQTYRKGNETRCSSGAA